ncbi:type II secretion system protein [Sulfurovum sp. ST-21]|uniref:Prepilin-type N-terminal cleavage/methylation domain-containing protein n=1 Tax=Sulfurovum indicum TaxID=2779528 RepID=A0A7M1S5E1_9BACT|nr:prepilin-type N-terminal cleavage/methylation domain-containing protein [Sulfurovum indicum]QOR62374.1 prepilin-type N-terminal cleavage/methylation domain-containing protein [Sulfurovum indicum]
MYLKPSVHRPAYTLLELVFAIVVLGIVSGIGAEIIANVYESYIIQRAQHRASLKTELASLQIANRLRYAIPDTIYRIKSDDTLESTNLPLSGTGDSYKGIQWVGYDGDSFESIVSSTNRKSGWSGFADVEHPSTDISHIKTQGSSLDLTDTIISNLSPNGKSIGDAYIYFPLDTTAYRVASDTTGDIIHLASSASKTVKEHYKLAWSSYALSVENRDLYLYYDFPATPAANKGNTKQLLLKNVSTFKFKVSGRTIRFKLCIDEEIGGDYNITSCKEKAVF